MIGSLVVSGHGVGVHGDKHNPNDHAHTDTDRERQPKREAQHHDSNGTDEGEAGTIPPDRPLATPEEPTDRLELRRVPQEAIEVPD